MLDAADHMIKTQKTYTAAELAIELDMTPIYSANIMYMIHVSPKFEVETLATPNRTLKVLGYGKKDNDAALSRLAIFGVPL
jgi:hypothetical protein